MNDLWGKHRLGTEHAYLALAVAALTGCLVAWLVDYLTSASVAQGAYVIGMGLVLVGATGWECRSHRRATAELAAVVTRRPARGVARIVCRHGHVQPLGRGQLETDTVPRMATVDRIAEIERIVDEKTVPAVAAAWGEGMRSGRARGFAEGLARAREIEREGRGGI